MKDFFKPTKLKIGLAGIFLVAVYFVVNFYGLHTLLIEKITDENPEAKITIYLETIKNQNKTEALMIWELPNLPNEEISLLKNRRENLTKDLIENGIKDFDILKIEWWRTCCEFGVITSPVGAGGARVHVQIIDNSNNKNTYIFDIFHRQTSYWGDDEWNIVRNWVIRDIYPENQEPLFWQYSI